MFRFRSGGRRLSVEEARARTAAPSPTAVLLDVREGDEWRAGHAPGAVHAPLRGLSAGRRGDGPRGMRPGGAARPGE
ncbi:rhodanese-like domain-containing protein, partial [Streptomyces sp. NPDC006422]|uniref:rhodanese-like domain-containing protein n=1 Tax=Streptomyces sp. NPDC006422 TaxID=3155457 RepID=UPI0033AEE22A